MEARTLTLAHGLRCPVCQGMSVADSSSEAAVNMKNRIRELVTAGYTDDQIEDYFIDRYGTWVLLEPPDDGVNR
ncbi:MAG: cytochrome c-type biogenesis protein CcmH, partial [Alphaproteobacteria bacterium]|nr:cytochrome c-type biogenesis protein CcmH [Alphaproteobacteria bacterium]